MPKTTCLIIQDGIFLGISGVWTADTSPLHPLHFPSRPVCIETTVLVWSPAKTGSLRLTYLHPHPGEGLGPLSLITVLQQCDSNDSILNVTRILISFLLGSTECWLGGWDAFTDLCLTSLFSQLLHLFGEHTIWALCQLAFCVTVTVPPTPDILVWLSFPLWPFIRASLTIRFKLLSASPFQSQSWNHTGMN